MFLHSPGDLNKIHAQVQEKYLYCYQAAVLLHYHLNDEVMFYCVMMGKKDGWMMLENDQKSNKLKEKVTSKCLYYK